MIDTDFHTKHWRNPWQYSDFEKHVFGATPGHPWHVLSIFSIFPHQKFPSTSYLKDVEVKPLLALKTNLHQQNSKS